MPPPFSCYLRVYEPLDAFQGDAAVAVKEALERGPVAPAEVAAFERDLCLVATARGRLLPEQRCDVLITTRPDESMVVCPLDLRGRAAAALLQFLDEAHPATQNAVLPAGVSLAAVRRHADAAVAELLGASAHVLSATWTVPLVWFAIFRQEERRFEPAPRRVYWQIGMELARERVAVVEDLVRDMLGDGEPADTLLEIKEWLELFDQGSVLEMDYGGIVELMDAEALESDRTAADIHVAMAALGSGDGERAGRLYERVREFWAPVAAREGSG